MFRPGRRLASAGAAGGLVVLVMTTTAPAAVPPRAKVPTLVRDQAAAMRHLLRQTGRSVLSARQARAVAGGVTRPGTDERLDVVLHALGTVGAARTDELRSLGVKVLGNSSGWADVP